MASSGSMITNVIDDGTYFYVNWQQSSQNIGGNYTDINWQHGVHCRYNYYSNAIKSYGVNINGSNVYGGGTFSNLYQGDHQLASGTLRIYHNNDGTKTFNINTGGWAIGAGDASGSQNFTLNKIPRQATITNAPNFNDEENPTITYSNPAGNVVSTLQVCIANTAGNVIYVPYRDVSKTGTSYTFELTEEERNTLRNATPDNNTMNIKFYAKTILSGNTMYNSVQKTMTIVNGNPTFSNFEYEDINSVTLALTGNNKYNINGYSNIKATISVTNKATAIKGATMSKYRFTCGTNAPVEVDYSSDNAVELTMNGATNGTYNIYAIDSRGNTTLVTKLATREIVYTPISLNASNSKVERNDGGIGEYADLTYSGNIWNNSFGSVTNSVKSSSYQYKATDSNTWITPSSPTDITPTLSGNNFSFSDLIRSNEQDYKFDLQKNFDFRITIQDELSSTTIQLTPMPSGIPNLCYADDGIGIMQDYDESLGGALQVGGDIFVNGKNINEDVYSTDEVKTNKVWIDNKPIYRIVYTGTTTPDAIYTVVTTTFSGNIIKFGGIVINTANNVTYSLVGENSSTGDFIFPYFQNGTTIQLVNSSMTKTFDYYLVIEYTKVND